MSSPARRGRAYGARISGSTSASRARLATLLRTAGGRHLFTVKTPLANEMACLEHEAVVADCDQMHHAVVQMGFHLTVRIVKTRRIANGTDHRSHSEQSDAIAAHIRWHNQQAQPKTSFATSSPIRSRTSYPANVA
jgi:hypothetical protein